LQLQNQPHAAQRILVNGFRLKATQAEATLTILDVAAGVMDEAALAQWIRDHIQAR